jgi:hypothetical protein
MSGNVARLSPVQCAANLPEPANVERDKTNGRVLRFVFSALLNMYRSLYNSKIRNDPYVYVACASK